MKNLQTGLFPLLIAMLLFQACSLVPLTGRRQLSLVSDADMLSTSFVQYDQIMKENKQSTNTSQKNMVKGIGSRIQNAVTTYFVQNNLSQELDGFSCEFNLIESEEVNAWCMPGGKVVVYSGILPITQNETGLAVVMGHEIAHAVAKHSNERMSLCSPKQAARRSPLRSSSNPSRPRISGCHCSESVSSLARFCRTVVFRRARSTTSD